MEVENGIKQVKILISEGKDRQARSLLRKIAKVDSANAEVFFLFSKVAEHRKDKLNCLERAIKINPYHNEAKAELLSLYDSMAKKRGGLKSRMKGKEYPKSVHFDQFDVAKHEQAEDIEYHQNTDSISIPFPYQSIWNGFISHTDSVEGIIEFLSEHAFPFYLNIPFKESEVEYIPPERRKIQIQICDVILMPYIIQKRFSPSGPLSRTIGGTKEVVFGAKSKDSLIYLLEACGFDFQAGSDKRTIGRQHIPKDVQQFVWQRDGGKCIECGSNENLEFDHIIPVSKDGSNTARNIQLLCEKCNRQKGAKLGG
jgi:hypothetical protein